MPEFLDQEYTFQRDFPHQAAVMRRARELGRPEPREVVTECVCGQLDDVPGPLTCERCGAAVHNLSVRGECITCIAGGDALPESGGCTCCQVRTGRAGADDDECPKCGHLMGRHYRSGMCSLCGTVAVRVSELGLPARWTHADIVAAMAACGGTAHAPVVGYLSAAPR